MVMKTDTVLFSEIISKMEIQQFNYCSYFSITTDNQTPNQSIKLLPSDDAVAYTIKFDYKTRSVYEGERNWYNEPLLEKIDLDRLMPLEIIRW